jgi:hypothetical protein
MNNRVSRRLDTVSFSLAMGVALTASLALAAASMPAHAQGAGSGASQSAEGSSFLPDTALLARVADRVIRVKDFLDGYFSTSGAVRPAPDSAGRVEYLQTLIKKDVLGLAARAINPPLTFEDRAALRDAEEQALSNVLYQRMVLDSVSVTDEDVLADYERYKTELRIRHIVFGDRETAERVRLQLLSGRTQWRPAVKAHSKAADREGPDGEIGWMTRHAMTHFLAEVLYGVRVGEFTPIVEDRDGYHILQVTDRRTVSPPAFPAIRRLIRSELLSADASQRALRLRTRLAKEVGIRYDSLNVRFAAPRFPIESALQRDSLGPILDLGANTAPTFDPADRARVLARYEDKMLTLGEFVDSYANLSALARPSVGTFSAMCEQINLFILEPYFSRLARERGFVSDPLTSQMVERRREQMLVERVYQDSVAAKVRVTPEDRRAYYDAHLDEFISTPQIRFATFVRKDVEEARMLLQRLDAGADADSMVLADSLSGSATSFIQQRYRHERGPLHTILFEEMKAREARLVGPGREGDYLVLKIIDRNEGRQIPFAELGEFIDESLRNIRAEQLLNALIDRYRAKFPVVAYPERVARIELADPVLRR